jgi:hypothetical protein
MQLSLPPHMILNRKRQAALDFVSVAITLINEKAIKENEMHKLKVLSAAVALLFVTPVLAQEMGGALDRAAHADWSPLTTTATTTATTKERSPGLRRSGVVRSKATTHTP